MWENSWRFVDLAIQNPLVLGELEDIIQGRINDLITVGLNVCPKIYAWIIDCTNPCVAWVRLETQYQFVNNAAHLMFKDKLSNLCLHEKRFVTKYFK